MYVYSNAIVNSSGWNGQKRLYWTALCEGHLFIMKDRGQKVPDYFITIDFMRLKVLRNEKTREKQGFLLSNKE
jgi:hypothetical protein